MNEFSTYEFVVAQKHEGKVQLFRILAVVSYVLFFCVVAAALILLHLPWMVAVLPIFEWILIFFTWRYRSVEFEYSMTSGNITFSYIYGGRSRKTALETAIKRFQEIAPLDDAALYTRCPDWRHATFKRSTVLSPRTMHRIFTMLCWRRMASCRSSCLRRPRKHSEFCASIIP